MLDSAEPYKISFCTTCKDRLNDYLTKTLPANLEACKDYPNVEFVILDYDCPQGTAEWVKSTYPDEIRSGKIRVAKFEPASTFKMAHAKNMAHRLATGDILCNLDADNLLTPGTAEWLNETFHKNPKSIVRAGRVGMAIQRQISTTPLMGVYGRVALMKDDFEAIHGYDEYRHNGYGGDDDDILNRGRLYGLKHVSPPPRLYGSALLHPDELRLRHISESGQEISQKWVERNSRSMWEKLHPNNVISVLGGYELDNSRPIEANPEGQVGCGTVRVNFDSTDTTIEPLPAVTQTFAKSYVHSR